MRKNGDFAKVLPETTVLESLMAMTKAKSGCAVVADGDGKLKGVFTDGDFRRHMSSADEDASMVLAAPVAKYMTASPMSIGESAYAAEIVKVFEERRIDDLPVVDAEGRAIGLVDIQDLPKMKVL
jgi:arabinose-5-phosphate isomerase